MWLIPFLKSHLLKEKLAYYGAELLIIQHTRLFVEQPELFSTQNFTESPFGKRQDKLVMSRQQLIQWKNRIFKHQEKVRQAPPKQKTLFDNLSKSTADIIDPFNLKLHNPEFYRMPDQGEQCCLYFILDMAMPILLYVGETKQTVRDRWGNSGTNHDCERYISNYISLHRYYDLEVQACSAFYYDVPEDTRSRQRIESELIYKWRSPFNKENWKWWGQPFQK
ncbi:MAG: GIY-YIG nuclease family protein [Halothece sp.]